MWELFRARLQLRHEMRRRGILAARQLAGGNDPEAVRAELAWIGQARDALGATGRSRYAPVAGAMLCLCLAGLAWTRPIETVNLSLDIRAEGVNLHLADDWDGRDIGVHGVSFDAGNLNRVRAPGFDIDGEYGAFALKDGDLVLHRLGLPRGARLDLERLNGGLVFSVRQGAVTAELASGGGRFTLSGRGGNRAQTVGVAPEMPPEPVTIEALGSEAEPVRLGLKLAADAPAWRMSGLVVDGMGFSRGEPPGSGQRRSTVLRGEVTLLETGRTVTLREADRLELDALHSSRLVISGDGQGLRIRFQGSAGDIRVGPGHFVRSLMPTWLGYLYHRQRLALFWCAVMFLWGMFWSARKLWGNA